MLKLNRFHTRFIENENGDSDMEVVLNWTIGVFKSFKDVEKYLCEYHNYGSFDVREYRKITIAIGEYGHCYLPSNCEENVDGTMVRFYVEVI